MHRNDPPAVSRHTRERILQESARLFATSNYASVTMRDIALACGIQPSSIYNYYEGKDKLLDEILQRFRTLFRDYFAQIDLQHRDQDSLDEVMEGLFAHLSGESGVFLYYGLGIVVAEQYHNELARQIVFDLFHVESVARVSKTFDRLRERGSIPAQNTSRAAGFFVCFLMIGNLLRLHEHMGHALPFDNRELFGSLRQYLTRAIAEGV